LKSVRNLYMIVTLVVAISLLAGGLAQWLSLDLEALDRDSGPEEGGRFAAYYMQRVPVVSACCIGGAVGVIWLGWYWLKLAGAITSIAKRLRADNIMDSHFSRSDKTSGNALIDELSQAVSGRLDSYSKVVGRLEQQINDLQIQIQLTKHQKGHIEAIIYSIHDAVIVIDEFDRLLMANEAAGRLFNFNFSDSQHKRISELIEEGKSEFIDFLRHSRQSKAQPTKKEIEISKDEELKTYDCIVSCIYDEGRQVCGVVAVLHDITREKQIQQTKNDFVNHVCHELKTPLASISAYSEMLIDGEADDEKTRKEFYAVIQSQAQRLNRLIEDSLNISRIESGLIKLNKEPVSLTILIEEQLQMIKSYAEEKNICIKDIGQTRIVFDQVYADRDMISQVIVNLLSNAVKYTPSGGSVNIETEVDETVNIARLSVIDTGVGIPESEIDHVFDKFYRVSSNSRQAKGTGLGLNLVKQIIEKLHNGRVFVSSSQGLGSTFGFELPLATQRNKGTEVQRKASNQLSLINNHLDYGGE
jgi:two-component system phosphate regulon sensor histidine kinase PhoR